MMMKQKKTMRAIIRAHWPVGLYTYTDIIAKYPGWLDDVVSEFRVSYIFLYIYIISAYVIFFIH